jgi:opacity protein-like surface antigen
MKKLLLSAIIAVLGLTSLQAQEVTFGAKAGVNFANLSGDLDDADSKIAFHVGGVAEIKITEKFSVQPELLYSALGAKYEEEDYSEKINLDYISIPLLAKYYIAEGFSVEAGPQIGFLISAKSEYEETFEGETTKGTEDLKDFIKGSNLGLNFGLGYKLNNGLNFGTRYGLGLSNIAKEEGVDIKTIVFQLSVGYMF